MSYIVEARAALKRAQDAIILSNPVLALDAIDDALGALIRAETPNELPTPLKEIIRE